ncbi:MAG: HEPN domain-containing protein, partial [Spirochaetaceae bacterium]|nr:HEPN domain-containing protein [Spirochaetaceae bacterium]
MPEINLIKEWLRYANNDLITAQHMFEDVYPKQTEMSAYHCQQCTEKGAKIGILANFC